MTTIGYYAGDRGRCDVMIGDGKASNARPIQDIARDLAVDSLALMNIVMELEDRFDLSIPLDRLATVSTVGDLSDLINKLRMKA